MRIDIDIAMAYQVCVDEKVLLTLEAADTDGQTILDSDLIIENATLHRIDAEGKIGKRVWAFVSGDQLNLRYRASVDVHRPTVVLDTLPSSPMHTLPSDVLTYVRPSRFCQSDLFTAFVSHQFGHLDGGAKVMAILNWVAAEICYVPGSSNAETTAVDTFTSRQGVCRDYTHMVCSLTRAAGIPARYASVYGPWVNPPDFHAVAQVWLDGAWHVIDATGMGYPDNLAIIGAGRDASDVAFMETENWAQQIYQNVLVSQTTE